MNWLIFLFSTIVPALSAWKTEGGGLSECVDGGNSANWLSVELIPADSLSLANISTHTAGRSTGPNFCLGHTNIGEFHIRLHAQLQCNVKAETFHRTTLPPKLPKSRAKRLKTDEKECGKFDYNAPTCANFATRQLANLAARTSESVEEFVSMFHRFTLNKDWTVAAVSFENADNVGVRQNVYTDANVCAMTLSLRNGQKLVLLAANLKPIYSFLPLKTSRISPLLSINRPFNEAKPFGGMEKASHCPLDEGHWAEMTFNGLNRVSFAGQFQFGENFCIYSDPSDNRTLGIAIRQHLTCDGDSAKSGGNDELMSVKTVAKKLTDPSGRCALDYTHGQCINERVKALITYTLSKTQALPDITNRVFSSLSKNEGNLRTWSVFAADFLEDFAISRTLRSDPGHCFVVQRVKGVTLAIMASKNA